MLAGGVLYAYGGRYVADGAFSQDLLRVPIYNERVSEWEHMNANLTRIPPAANGHTLTAWNGILFLVHGWDSYEYFRAVWALDLRQLYLTGTAVCSSLNASVFTSLPFNAIGLGECNF